MLVFKWHKNHRPWTPRRSLTTSTVGYPSDSWASCWADR